MRWFFLLFSFTAYSTEVYFSPSKDCEDRTAQAIKETKQEISAAVYSINNKKIVDALLEAKVRGVKIRILTDHIQATQRSSRVLEMIQNGLPVRVHSKHKIEHNKFAVYDGALVGTGSFNWTGPAARSNSENCVFLNEKEVIGKFQNRFETLWQMNTEDGSKARLAKIQVKRLLSSQRK